jgi:hypothetical protein
MNERGRQKEPEFTWSRRSACARHL